MPSSPARSRAKPKTTSRVASANRDANPPQNPKKHLTILAAVLAVTACNSSLAVVDAATHRNATAASAPVNYPGFRTFDADGRLVVFREEDAEAEAFAKHRDLGKSVTRIGAGPDGKTVQAPDAAVLDGWLQTRG